MGMIFIDPVDGKTPLLFEANGIERVPLKPHHSKSGVYLTPLEDRVKKYKGRCFWKPLNNELPPAVIVDFKKFVQYAIANMHYEYNVIQDAIKKGLGIERCANATNCGQLIFLSLIKLGLLPYEYYDFSMFSHLKWLTNLTNLQDGYEFLPLIEIVEHPFAS